MREQYELMIKDYTKTANKGGKAIEEDYWEGLETTVCGEADKLIQFESDDGFEDAFANNRLVLNGCHLSLKIDSLQNENLQLTDELFRALSEV